MFGVDILAHLKTSFIYTSSVDTLEHKILLLSFLGLNALRCHLIGTGKKVLV